VRGDLIRIMTKLLARPEKLDMIIIETTGVKLRAYTFISVVVVLIRAAAKCGGDMKVYPGWDCLDILSCRRSLDNQDLSAKLLS